MTPEEVKQAMLNLRTQIVNKTISVEDGKVKLEELRSLKAQNEKREAMEKAPLETRGKKKMAQFADAVKNAELNKRSTVTLSGTGNQKTLSDLVKSSKLKTDLLNHVKITYGANASTVVPVYSRYGNRLGPVAEGGQYSDTAGTLSKIDLVPYTFGGKFMLSKMAQDLSEVELDAEVEELMNDEIIDAICYEIFQGTGASGHFKGLQNATYGASSTTATVSTGIGIADLKALALKLADKNYKDPAIYISPSAYSDVVASFGSTAADKVYAETFMRDKMIENIPVVVTGYVAYSSTSGDIIAVGGDLANSYGIACAKEMNVERKPVAGNAYDSFDFEAYLAGAPIIRSDFEAITVQ